MLFIEFGVYVVEVVMDKNVWSVWGWFKMYGDDEV